MTYVCCATAGSCESLDVDGGGASRVQLIDWHQKVIRRMMRRRACWRVEEEEGEEDATSMRRRLDAIPSETFVKGLQLQNKRMQLVSYCHEVHLKMHVQFGARR